MVTVLGRLRHLLLRVAEPTRHMAYTMIVVVVASGQVAKGMEGEGTAEEEPEEEKQITRPRG